MKVEKRKSNIELLRILSILLIITFHCAYKSGFDFESGMSANKLSIKTFWMFGELGVNEFMLISGFFLIDGSFKIKKFIQLVAQVEFYHWGLMILYILWKRTIHDIGWKEMILNFFPIISNKYWFFTAYILIYILCPYINQFAKAMNREMYKRFLVTILVLYCVLPTIFGVIYNDTETLLYYTRFLWLMIIYLLGAYIKSAEAFQMFLKGRAMLMSILSFMVCVASIIIFDHFNCILEKNGFPALEIAYFWHPNSLPMLFLSIGLFSIFLKIEIPNSKLINRVASTTLGIYLLHDGVLQGWLWGTVFQCASYQESPYLVLHIMKAVIIVFVFGVVIDLIRQWIETSMLNKIFNKDKSQ